MHEWLTTLASSPTPQQQQAVGRAFLLLVVLIVIGILVVIGLIMAGFAWYAKRNTDQPERKDRFKGIDAWEESARRTHPDDESNSADDPDDDWEADED